MGKRLVETYAEQVELENRRPDLKVNRPFTVKTGFACRQADLMGIITASGLLRRRTQAKVTGTAFATNSPTGTVDDASVFAVGDALKNAAGSAVGTILSINLETNTITLSANASNAVATDANVFGSDGSQTAAVIADEGSDGVGDTPITTIVQSPAILVSRLRGLDSTAITDLGGKVVAGELKF